METTKALKQGGTLTEAAVKQSQALIYNAQSLLVQIDNQTEVTENAFNLLLASEPKTVERGTLEWSAVVYRFGNRCTLSAFVEPAGCTCCRI